MHAANLALPGKLRLVIIMQQATQDAAPTAQMGKITRSTCACLDQPATCNAQHVRVLGPAGNLFPVCCVQAR
jgi:hypothetical protein